MTIEELERRIPQQPDNNDLINQYYMALSHIGAQNDFIPRLGQILGIQEDPDLLEHSDWLSYAWHALNSKYNFEKKQYLEYIVRNIKNRPKAIDLALEPLGEQLSALQKKIDRAYKIVAALIEEVGLTQSQIDNDIQIYPGYAPGSGDPDVVVVAANWNEPHLAQLGDRLEQLESTENIDVQWSDIAPTTCDHCYRAIITEPSFAGQWPSYLYGTDYWSRTPFEFCRHCVKEMSHEVLSSFWGGEGELDTAAWKIDPRKDEYMVIADIPIDSRNEVARNLSKYTDQFFFDSGSQSTLIIWATEDALEELAEDFETYTDNMIPEEIEDKTFGQALMIYLVRHPNTSWDSPIFNLEIERLMDILVS